MKTAEFLASLEGLPRDEAVAQIEGALLGAEVDPNPPPREDVEALRVALLRLRSGKR